MISDPYRVLGVTEDVSDEALKKAYREKSKKWHPDQNPDNQEYAEERFKEVQEAYRQIVDNRARGTSAYGPSYGSAQGNAQTYSSGYGYAEPGGYRGFEDMFRQWQRYSEGQRAAADAESNEEKAARNYINNGYYNEAITALGQVGEASRGARWYFYSAIAQRGVGNNMTALEHAKKAVDLEPDNGQYSSYLRQLQTGGVRYQDRTAKYSPPNGLSGGSVCVSLCLLNICCNCAGGGGWFCCL